MEGLFLFLAMGAFGCAVAASAWRVGSGRPPKRAWDFLLIFAGFFPLCAALYFRGKAEGSCPLNSLYDVLVFLAWALVLIYLLVGSAYRISLLGVFTAPLALAFLGLAVAGPLAKGPVVRPALDPWVETHAALSVIAYGAFGLACVAGVMYLLQERQLKRHRFSKWFFSLPPISDLSVANRRLLVLGFSLLSAGFVSGWVSGLPVNSLKYWVSLGIWAIYGGILLANRLRPWPAGRMAAWSVTSFVIAMVALPGVQYLSGRP